MGNGSEKVGGFGLVTIGSEVLDGRVRDQHFENARAILEQRRHALRYALVIPDEPGIIEDQLRWAMARPEPFFCCGGIGATPDDYTRACAARVAGVGLELHPEGVAVLESRFGRDLTPARLRLVEFPVGSDLIPNPFNRVPGFRIRNGHFLPGFPEMARPMMEWVVDHGYGLGEERACAAVLLPGAREGDLCDLMDAFTAAHPDVVFSSLPRFTGAGTEVTLGLKGRPDSVRSGLADLRSALERAGVRYRVKGEPG